PFTRGVESATFTAVGTSNTYGRRRAKGEIFFAPEHGFAITETIDGRWAEQQLDVGGYGYTRESPSGGWHLDGSYCSEFFYLDWDGSPLTDHLSVSGPVEMDGEQAWHLDDRTGDQWWVGVQTGHPLQAIDEGLRYTFSDFGRAPKLRAPAKSRILTRIYQGPAGRPVAAPLETVTVSGAQREDHLNGTYAPPGYEYLSVQVTVVNTSAQPLGIDLDSPPAMGVRNGGEYWQDLLAEQPGPPGGGQKLAPGASESATLVYDVETNVRQVLTEFSSEELDPDPSAGYLIVVPVKI
ncbi:MAG: DUF4352 domain-containing protein, partial [Candidatus Dormibacteraceae bacterium]